MNLLLKRWFTNGIRGRHRLRSIRARLSDLQRG